MCIILDNQWIQGTGGVVMTTSQHKGTFIGGQYEASLFGGMGSSRSAIPDH